jgi:hypothetical protein
LHRCRARADTRGRRPVDTVVPPRRRLVAYRIENQPHVENFAFGRGLSRVSEAAAPWRLMPGTAIVGEMPREGGIE